MVKVQIKSEKLTSFGGIFPIMEKFDRMLSCTIDSTLGLRSKVYGYQYSEIIRSLMCVYFCGGSCVEDVTSHHMETLCLHPHLRTCSADTILRAIRELTTPNLTYRSDSGKSYDFYVAPDLNNLLVNALLATGQLLPDNEYDFDFEKVARVWNNGSVIRSWLVELVQESFKNDPKLEMITGASDSSGEAQWTVEQALKLKVPTPVISLSLMMRYRSKQNDTFAGKVVSALRNAFGGHSVTKK